MTTKHKTIAGILAALVLASVQTHAASILWLDSVDTANNSGAGRAPDASWVNLLTSAGHTVTTFDSSTYAWNLSNQASIDYVNSFDVVIATRTNNLFNTIRAHGTAWKQVSTPMIEMNPFMVGGQFSSGTWNWLASGTGNTPGQGNNPTNVADPLDPIWDGVALINGNTQAPGLYSGNAGNYFGLNGNALLPGISVVASDPNNSNNVLIAYAEPGALSPTSGARYFINWGGDLLPMQFNSAGQQVFLNAIAILTIPEPSTAMLGGLGVIALLLRRRRS